MRFSWKHSHSHHRNYKNPGKIVTCLLWVTTTHVNGKYTVPHEADLSPFRSGPKAWASISEGFLTKTLEKCKLMESSENLLVSNMFKHAFIRYSYYLKTSRHKECPLLMSLDDFRKLPTIVKKALSKKKQFPSIMTWYDCNSMYACCQIWKHLPRKYLIERTTGELTAENFPGRHCAPDGAPADPFIIYWHVLLDKRTAFQLQFKIIYILSRYPGMCLPTQSFHVRSTSAGIGKRDDFIFCGVISSFELYPPSHKLDMTLSSQDDPDRSVIRHKVSFSYSLIDSDRIQSQPVNFTKDIKHSTILREIVVLLGSKSVLSFLVSVHKMYRIKVNCSFLSPTIHRLHDGPATSSAILNFLDNIVHTKTFQAFAVLHTTLPNKYLHFKQVLLPCEMSACNFLSDSENRSLSIFDPDLDPKLTRIVVPENVQAKITILGMSFSGLLSYNCTHGGVAAFDQSGTELIWLCESHVEGRRLNRDIYSPSSQMFIVMYRYEGQGNIAMNLSVEASECHATHIDPCVARQACSIQRSVIQRKKECDRFLKSIDSKFINFSGSPYLDAHIYWCDKRTVHLWYTIKMSNSCIVLQVWPNQIVMNDPEKSRDDRCMVRLEDSLLFRFGKANVKHNFRISVPPTGFPFRSDTCREGISVARSKFHNMFQNIAIVQSNTMKTTKGLKDSMCAMTELEMKSVSAPTKHRSVLPFCSFFDRQQYSSFWVEVSISFSKFTTISEETTQIVSLGQSLNCKYLFFKLDASKHLFLLVEKSHNQTKNRYYGKLQIEFDGHCRTQRKTFLHNISRGVDFITMCLNISTGKAHSVLLPVDTVDLSIERAKNASFLWFATNVNKEFSGFNPPYAYLFLREVPHTSTQVERSSSCFEGTHLYYCHLPVLRNTLPSVDFAMIFKRNVPVFTSNKKYVMYMRSKTMLPNDQWSCTGCLSWKDANLLCKQITAFLPRLYDTEAVRRFGHLLDGSHNLPFVEAVFMGITLNVDHKFGTKVCTFVN